jgi:hypothetical protein
MLIVKKFGGSSVANKERIYNVAKRCIEDYKAGHDVVVVNTPLKGSQVLLDAYNENKCDLMCVFFFNGKNWEYSFYTESDKVNCAYICKNLAKDDTGIGGGHKKAAGCTLTYNFFSRGSFTNFTEIDKVE